MDRFTNMQAFLDVAELNSFSAAARRQGISKSVISKRVDQLEAGLGTSLFHRTTRVVKLTESGQIFYEYCRDILDRVAAAEQALRKCDSEPDGHLRLSCPTSLGTVIVGPLVCEFQRRYPKMRVTLLLLDRNPNPIEEGFDISIWDQPSARGNLGYRRIAPLQRTLVAAPSYLATHGTPSHPDQLYRHRTIHYQYLEEGRDWRLTHPDLGQKSTRIAPTFTTNNGLLMRQVALAGKGIALLPMFLVKQDLASRQLQRVLPSWQPATYHILALFAPAKQTQSKVRLFLEMLQGAFQTEGGKSWEES